MRTLYILLVTIQFLFFLLQFPFIQNYLTGQVEAFLSNQLKTTVEIGQVNFALPNFLVVKDVLVLDYQQDTLLHTQELRADLFFEELLKNSIVIDDLILENATAKIYQQTDSMYNYQALLNALSDPTKEEETSGTAWHFAFKKARLQKVNVQYSSLEDKIDFKTQVGGLRTEVKEIDLENLKVHLAYLDLKDADITYNKGFLQQEENGTENSQEGNFPDLFLKEFSISNVTASYTDSTLEQKALADISTARIVAQKTDLANRVIILNRALLYDSEVTFDSWAAIDTLQATDEKTSPDTTSKSNWFLRLYELEMAGNKFAYNKTKAPKLLKGLDYNHLLIYDQSAYAENIIFGDSILNANLNQFSFTEKSGFRIKQFKTNLAANNQKLVMRNFLMETGNSLLNEYIALEYNGLKNIANQFEELSINISLNQAKLGLADILYFQPELYQLASERSLKRATASVDLRLKGSLKALDIQKFRIKLLRNSFARFQGNVTNVLTDLGMNLNIDTLNLTSADINTVLGESTLLEGFEIPQNTGLKGFFKGTLHIFESNLRMRSTLGNIGLGIVQKIDSAQTEPTFNAVIDIDDLQVGKALKMQEGLGSVHSYLVIQGKGLREATPVGTIRGTIEQATVLNYPYQNASIEGDFSLQGFNGEFALNDPNAKLNYNGEVTYKENIFSTDFKIKVDTLNIAALGFLEAYDSLSISTEVTSRLRRNAEGFFNGEVFLKDLLLTQGTEIEPLQLNNLEAFVTENDNRFDLSLVSDWVNMNIKSNAPSALTVQEIPSVFYNYYQYSSLKPITDSIPRNLHLKGKLKETDFITQLFYTDIQELSEGDFDFSFDQTDNSVEGNVFFSYFKYADFDFSNLQLMLEANSEQLDYTVGLSEIVTETFSILNPSISGEVYDSQLHTQLNLNDSIGTQQFLIGGLLSGQDSSFQFHFIPEEFKLNYQDWAIPKDNYISFSKQLVRSKGLFFKKSGGKESFGVDFSGTDSTTTDVVTTFKDFEMSFLTKAVQTDEKLLGGVVNGQVALQNILDTLKVTADFGIRNFELLGDTLGNISLKADNDKNQEVYEILTTLTERGNDVKVSGTYRVVSTKNPINLVIEVNSFNLNSINNLAFGQVSNLSGAIEDSRIVFRGNTDQPIVRGSIYISELAFVSSYLNSGFSLSDERIRFGPRGIHFEDFLLKDQQKREAMVNGDIFTTNYTDYRFNLDVATNNFLVLNTNANDNELFYGKVLTSSDVKITGTPSLPKVSMNARILEGTKLTYILPDENLETVNRAGVVEFIDMDSDSSIIILEKEETEDPEVEGFDFEANIEIDNTAQMTIIIDPEAGDKLTVQGGGNLSFTMDPSGTMTLAGIYSIENGDYLLTFYDLVKRRFKIKPGSQLVWTGDPYDAELDITALYETKANPSELLPPTDNSEEEKARQQQLPFIVGLTMKGALDAPNVLFRIDLPPLNKGALNGTVHAQLQRLNQEEAELNKQVFALLILNSFISSNPLDGNTQTSLVTSTARTSVSRLLTQQLNRLSNRYLKGLDLNFELNSYDGASGSVEGRTELGVKLSKQLFNERVVINVGGNVNLTDDAADQTGKNAQQIAGNVSLEYKLSKDGRYRLRAYRRNAFEGLIDGDFIETGVSFIFTKDYNSFKELFKKANSKEKSKKKKKASPAKNSDPPKIKEEE